MGRGWEGVIRLHCIYPSITLYQGTLDHGLEGGLEEHFFMMTYVMERGHMSAI